MKELHVAAYNADAESVREFLRLGADPNERDERGFTPLLWTALRGAVANQVPVVEALIDAGADPNAVTDKGDSTVLMWAVQSGNLDVICALLKGGADANRAADEVTPLMVAARGGLEGVVRLLLDVGADPDAKAGRFTAADYASHGGYEDVAKILRRGRDGVSA
jgi:ankyrin repeat protein